VHQTVLADYGAKLEMESRGNSIVFPATSVTSHQARTFYANSVSGLLGNASRPRQVSLHFLHLHRRSQCTFLFSCKGVRCYSRLVEPNLTPRRLQPRYYDSMVVHNEEGFHKCRAIGMKGTAWLIIISIEPIRG
jgi:hypothetical protein